MLVWLQAPFAPHEAKPCHGLWDRVGTFAILLCINSSRILEVGPLTVNDESRLFASTRRGRNAPSRSLLNRTAQSKGDFPRARPCGQSHSLIMVSACLFSRCSVPD
ncbi:uncharacterized protein PV07_06696 [Cladophialophora immunda]|uniref:Uncharacterized protein n=1 Tax=Cladophialophora immunda TaxID=569365 RepID=A0A0D2C6Y8_9EURO|nr:uncharacterized protein PV07_06696 [Cladophialophora immunda]KIW26908.1 hypothetical protein PV07_06696 [Cladophialophora immunda]